MRAFEGLDGGSDTSSMEDATIVLPCLDGSSSKRAPHISGCTPTCSGPHCSEVAILILAPIKAGNMPGQMPTLRTLLMRTSQPIPYSCAACHLSITLIVLHANCTAGGQCAWQAHCRGLQRHLLRRAACGGVVPRPGHQVCRRPGSSADGHGCPGRLAAAVQGHVPR